jgi:hypothetical protein
VNANSLAAITVWAFLVSDGRVSQGELHSRLGDWSNPMSLRNDLNDRDGGGWQGHYFASGEDAARKAAEGPMAAVVQAPHGPAHMVMLDSRSDGTFTVRDPYEGSSYDVDRHWVETYVSAGVAGVSAVRVKQITAVGDNEYEVVFDGQVDPSTILCTVDLSGSVPGVDPNPDRFMTGDYGDPRPIMAAVLAIHRARQID